MLLKGANIRKCGRSITADVLVRDGRIADISVIPIVLQDDNAADIVLDCTGLTLVSGFVDVHVHLREPGAEYKETMLSGTRAAARGGYTTVCAMPNLNPAPDSPEHLKAETDIIRRDAQVKVLPYATITKGQRGSGELVQFADFRERVAGFSDDGRGVQDEELMRRAMTEAAAAGGMIVEHCEVESLLHGGYIHDGRYAEEHGHRGISSESEWREVERNIRLSEETGCPLHLCHISTKESIRLIREAKARGANVTCETAPHYLLLCDEDLQEDGRFKMNPPLRAAEDRAALIEALLDGTVDMIATDHAPHSAEEKSRGLEGSAMGIVGLETAFPLLYSRMVVHGVLEFDDLMRLMSGNPRRRFAIGGGLEVGQPADLTLLDLGRSHVIDPESFLSMGHSTPFAGWQVQGNVVMTIVDGVVKYSDMERFPASMAGDSDII